MDELEPFKIKFTTVLIIVIILLIIIGILAYNLKRVNSTLNDANTAFSNNKLSTTTNPAVPEPNDYDYYIENYKKALESVLSVPEESEIFGEPLLQRISPDVDVTGISSITIDHLNDAYINIPQNSSLYSKYGKLTKIASDVIDAEFCHVGNGDSYSIFFIHKNGTVSQLVSSDSDGISFKGELSTKNLDGLISIIKIITIPVDNAEEAGFVDINGNIFKINGEAFE